jgi:lipid-A-disaccharide synthase
MKKNLKIFIIAGEVSGDVLGAKIMRAIPGARFVGVGGENMRAAGLRSLFPISDLAVMGLIEVIANARTLTRRINETAAAIIAAKPDIVLTIDSPSFAKRVIKKVKSGFGVRGSGLVKKYESRTPKPEPRFYHVVAPQVWAWGPRRAKKFAAIFDRLYAFFDFEAPYFEKYGLKTIPVGHPIADGLTLVGRQSSVVRNIALIPGSRMSEVKKLLPLFKEVVCQQTTDDRRQTAFFIPTVETTREYIARETRGWAVKPTLVPSDARYELFADTDIAVAASGTVSVELAIMHVPAIVVYKMNPITQFLARFFIRVKWVSLVNILLGRAVYPELLGPNATAENIVREIRKFTPPAARKKMIAELKRADKMWQRPAPAAELIARDIAATI